MLKRETVTVILLVKINVMCVVYVNVYPFKSIYQSIVLSFHTSTKIVCYRVLVDCSS